MDDYDEEDDFAEVNIPAMKWSWLTPVMRGAEFGSNLATCVSRFMDAMSGDIASHINHQIMGRNFQEQAAQEIESLVSSESDE